MGTQSEPSNWPVITGTISGGAWKLVSSTRVTPRWLLQSHVISWTLRCRLTQIIYVLLSSCSVQRCHSFLLDIKKIASRPYLHLFAIMFSIIFFKLGLYQIYISNLLKLSLVFFRPRDFFGANWSSLPLSQGPHRPGLQRGTDAGSHWTWQRRALRRWAAKSGRSTRCWSKKSIGTCEV